MPSPVSRHGAAVVAALLAAGALSACSDSDEPTATPSQSTTTTATTTTAATPAGNSPGPTKPKTDAADPVDVAIDVQIAKGRVTTKQPNAKARSGDRILLRVVSDVADEVHVHGVDKTLTLAARAPGSLIFVVKQKGTFEIETHVSKKVLAKLAVS